jgi:PAS domain S-box-containing protein
MLKNTPIQRKLMIVTLVVSGAMLLLTCSAYFAYEITTFRQTMIGQLSTLGEIVADNSTAALAFDSRDDAREILSSLKANKNIVSAALFDSKGNLFAYYPPHLSANEFLSVKPGSGYFFERSNLIGFQPVIHENKILGTLYLKSNMNAISDRLVLYGSIAVSVIVVSFVFAFFLTRALQKQISTPILELAEAAKVISERQDYSIRAAKRGTDEIGQLTEAFNTMLSQIEAQNLKLNESSAQLLAVMNSAMTAVIVIDSNGNITEWNNHAEEIFGWMRSEAIGQELAALVIPSQYKSKHRRGLQHFLTSGEGPVLNTMIEISALRRDGTEFPVELTVSPLKTENKIAFCGFITDITKRKQTEMEILSLNQQLEQKVEERTNELQLANRELESFSYSISHDLRAPLRSIHGYMNIFAEDYASKLDDEAMRLMNIILNNARRMGQLIDDLLAFSKLGRKELVKANVSMRAMADAICDEFKRSDEEQRIEIILKNLPDAYADSGTIKQVWANLISNAVKYSKNVEKAIIEIGAEDDGEHVTYHVKDNGAGFDMQYYDKLFGVFQRLHTAKEFEGTGVGLAIVHRIVIKHGGKLWAQAKVNEGATFYFSLPKRIPKP